MGRGLSRMRGTILGCTSDKGRKLFKDAGRNSRVYQRQGHNSRVYQRQGEIKFLIKVGDPYGRP